MTQFKVCPNCKSKDTLTLKDRFTNYIREYRCEKCKCLFRTREHIECIIEQGEKQ